MSNRSSKQPQACSFSRMLSQRIRLRYCPHGAQEILLSLKHSRNWSLAKREQNVRRQLANIRVLFRADVPTGDRQPVGIQAMIPFTDVR